jgi:hypothetical protein
MHELSQLKRADPLLDTLLAEYGLFHLEADLHWVDTATARLGELAALLTRGGRPPNLGRGADPMTASQSKWLIEARDRQVVRPDAGLAGWRFPRWCPVTLLLPRRMTGPASMRLE